MLGVTRWRGRRKIIQEALPTPDVEPKNNNYKITSEKYWGNNALLQKFVFQILALVLQNVVWFTPLQHLFHA